VINKEADSAFQGLWMDGVVERVLVVRAWDMYSDSASLTPHARPHLLAAFYLPPFKSAHNAKKLISPFITPTTKAPS